ncbi:MAG TPA: hypothetical protein VLH84_04965 [Patescibacteria group bacterium]|nr:hypothetical protein [Patescibacteria group bacterium]
MEQLLKSNILLLYIVLLMSVVIMGIKTTERMRVALIYGFSFCLALAGSISYRVIAAGSTVVLAVALEFISGDRMRNLLFASAFAKVKDFLYRLFIELSYAYFVISLFCLRAARQTAPDQTNAKIALIAIAAFAIARAFLLLAAPRYKTADITDIIGTIESKMLIYQMHITPHVRQLFAILAAIEDHSYFTRRPSQHTIAGRSILRKVFGYLRTHTLRENLRATRRLFSRGYGTIEMQLLRSIGVELGYNSTLRRKIFEFCYSGMIFNGYRNYLARGNGGYSRQQYREFIIYQYLENVGVKLNDDVYVASDQATILQVFGKQNLQQITKEEFYVWCLGLPRYDAIGPIAVRMHADVMRAFGIDEREVMRIVTSLR